MKNNNRKKLNLYTQGQRFAVRVLFIVWLCVSYSLEGALAVRRDGTKVSANTVALGSFGRLANIASGAAIWALLSVPVSSLDLLECSGECLAGDEQSYTDSGGPSNLEREDCDPSFFTNDGSSESVAFRNLWQNLKNFIGCNIVVNLEECGLFSSSEALMEKAEKLKNIRANLYHCLEDNHPVYIKSADIKYADSDVFYDFGLPIGEQYAFFYNSEAPGNLTNITCEQQGNSCVFIAGSHQPSDS